ncbi:MAG: rhomboid family intramembrane serine protease [Cyclobacteriaceae bacterium]|nr:rhomboid family intramembrane serine protease [Cyclobacteriaceae bacterium]MCH8515654.1 rhomboid family intramembrane serine protease [Cyclobacteriaceae bacterium]
MNNRGAFEEFKDVFRKSDNGLMQLISINVAVFFFLIILKVVFTLSGVQGLYTSIMHNIMLPSNLEMFIFKPWTLITYFFTHEGFFHILFNMLFLYWFGRLIVEFLGSKKLVNLFILGGIIGGLAYLLFYNLLPFYADRVASSKMLGASGGVYAVVVGSAVFMPDYRLNLILLGPVKIKWIAIVYVFLSFAGITGANAGGELAHLGGAAIGWFYISQLKKGNDIGAFVQSTLTFFKSFFVKSNDVKVSYRTKSKTTSSRTNDSKPKSNVAQNEIDAILDKISESGYESLSKDEKDKLFNASKD